MSTNYFNPISYGQRRPVQTPVQMPGQTSFTLPTQNGNWTNVTGWTALNPNTAAPNQGQISSLVSGLYGTGRPGEAGYVPGLNERVANMFGQARNNARDALRGYGGVSFRQDDLSTPNVDESLMMDYQPDQLGRNERQAVLAARARANATGMLSSGFADQQVGAALQRVGEEARQIVNQYSSQINQIANQYLDPLTGVAAQTLGQIQSLYGSDTQWAATQELTRRDIEAQKAAADAAAAQAAKQKQWDDARQNGPITATPAPTAPAGPWTQPTSAQHQANFPNIGGRYKQHPNVNTLNARFGYGNWLVEHDGTNWVVRVK